MATIRMLALSALLIASPAAGHRARADDKAIVYEKPLTYAVTQRITVRNQDVSALDMLELNVPVPLDWAEQKVQSVEVTGDDAFQLDDVDGLGRIVRSRYTVPATLPAPGHSRALEVRYVLTRREIRTDAHVLVRRRFDQYDERSAAYRLFTRREKGIEVDAPEIVELAAGMKARATTPYRFAGAAYRYVIEHTEYVTPSPSDGALACLHNGKADCGSYSLLFVALCRAGGVPARPVAGCWAMGDNQWHCWAEFFVAEVGWVPADPTAGQRGAREREYYFGNLDNNRVALAKTFNLAVETTRGSTELGFVQVGAWWWFPAPGSTGSQMVVEHFFHGGRAEASHQPK